MEYIELKNIIKTFYGVKALDDVSLSIRKGEVHAVVGENGAGKSTIMKILGGLYFADSGEIYIDGEKRHINNVQAAIKNEISVVYQELHLMPDLTVAENIYLHKLPSSFGFVAKRKMNQYAQALLDEMQVDIKATTPMSLLSVSQQQMVEIAKALSHHTDIIIMDEPTAALNINEVEALYQIIMNLKTQGKTVIYISHRLKEIFDISDRVSVLRDGKYIGTYPTGDITQDQLVEKMVGREVSQFYTTADHAYGETVLEVSNLAREGFFSDISFKLHKGEILGVAGLMGCFREEIVQSLYGLVQPDSGEILLEGKPVFVSLKRLKAIKRQTARVGKAAENLKSIELNVEQERKEAALKAQAPKETEAKPKKTAAELKKAETKLKRANAKLEKAKAKLKMVETKPKTTSKISTPRKAIKQGIGYVTEDRKSAGIFALMTARENLTISILNRLAKFGLVRADAEQTLLGSYTKKMNMKYRAPYQRMNSLSGGNQQKFLLARTLATDCRILIMLEPTRGIDVGAKAEIFSLLEDLAKSGMAIIVVSSELQEIIGNCHRTLVIFQGTLTGEIDKKDFDETLIMQCATGNKTALSKGADET